MNSIDSLMLKSMIASASNNLQNNRRLINDYNVFPVPDGDTGTNMSLTFSGAASAVKDIETDSCGELLSKLASAALRNARGNSGVILSQILRGLAKGTEKKKTLGVKEITSAAVSGRDVAYRAVMKPTEGTILTVVREIAEFAETKNSEYTDALTFLKDLLKEAERSLESTKEILPVLKQAGVVDAGGKGLVCIFEGFLEALNGKSVELLDKGAATTAKAPASAASTEKIKFAYCTEFIINKYDSKASAEKMRNAIQTKGDCMIVIDEDDIVKVHIHTNHPGYVLEQAVKLGEMVNIKIENMREQHTDLIAEAPAKKPEAEHKEVAVVAVANGAGLISTFTDLGVTNIIPGGQTMNPSTDDILSAIEEANADNVFVLPNNKNIILAAQQAAEIAECNVIVIESKTIPQGISAMMSYSASENVDTNTKKMTKALSKVVSGNITHAVKDTEMDGLKIHEGDIIGVSNGHILSSDKDIFTATTTLIKEIADDDSEIITLYYGEGVTEEDAQKIADAIENDLDEVEVIIANGGQSVYYYIISVE